MYVGKQLKNQRPLLRIVKAEPDVKRSPWGIPYYETKDAAWFVLLACFGALACAALSWALY